MRIWQFIAYIYGWRSDPDLSLMSASSAQKAREPWPHVQRPIAKGSKFTAEEIAADRIRFENEMSERFRSISRINREHAVLSGCKYFIWRTAEDSEVCDECAKFNGRRFRYSAPPKIGFPGDHHCPIGWCRCEAEPVRSG